MQKLNLIRTSIKLKKSWPFFALYYTHSLTYYTILPTLIMYMVHSLHFSSATAVTITASFLTIHYMLPIFSGYLCDHWASPLLLLIFCYAINAVSPLLLEHSFFWGLAIFIPSQGLIVSPFKKLFYEHCELNKLNFTNNSYTLYAFLGFSGVIGFFLSGYATLHNDYHMLFIALSAVMLSGLLIMLILYSQFKMIDKLILQKFNRILSIPEIALLFVTLILCSYFLMSTHKKIGYISILLTCSSITTLIYLFKKSDNLQRKNNVIKFSFIILINLLYWSVYQTRSLGIMIIIDHNINLSLFHHHIAPQWIQLLNPVIITITCLMLPKIYHRIRRHHQAPTMTHKLVTSFVLIGLTFASFAIGIYSAPSSHHVSIMWALLGIFFISVSECFMDPPSNATMAKLLPNHRALGSSMINMCLAISAPIASHISQGMISSNHSLETFISLSLVCILVAVALAYMRRGLPRIYKLLHKPTLLHK